MGTKNNKLLLLLIAFILVGPIIKAETPAFQEEALFINKFNNKDKRFFIVVDFCMA